MFSALKATLDAPFTNTLIGRIKRATRPVRRFWARILVWIPITRRLIYHVSSRPVPGSQRPRLVERRYFLFGFNICTRREQRNRYRVALLVDEFFGGWRTAIGGYGALARKYICKYVPNDQIEIDLLLNTYGMWRTSKKIIDQTVAYKLSLSPRERQQWLDEQGYDLFLSIEMTAESFLIISKYRSKIPVLYWIQDPRELEMYQSRLKNVTRLRDNDWGYLREVSAGVTTMMSDGRISFISQGESLSAIARRLYQIPESVPIRDLPNPVEIDFEYRLDSWPKRNHIVFLGRLEAQKRAWIVCEVAKRLPQYEFFILGATGRGRDQAGNAKSLDAYRYPDGKSRIQNLHFTGHVDGEDKAGYIKTAKLLLNTSLWEGIPISWLEALAYGTLIVSAFDRDDIVCRFGTYVGEIDGDGTQSADLDKLANAIAYWIEHDQERHEVAQRAIDFVRSRHSVAQFQEAMRAEILKHVL